LCALVSDRLTAARAGGGSGKTTGVKRHILARGLLRCQSGGVQFRPENKAKCYNFDVVETFPNPRPARDYEIEIHCPEFTSVCPKTGLPDFGTVTIRYMPDKHCLELKSLKEYLQCYRNLGIFQENIVNRVLEDVVRWAKPVWAEVKGDFRPRGGISTVVVARWPRPARTT